MANYLGTALAAQHPAPRKRPAPKSCPRCCEPLEVVGTLGAISGECAGCLSERGR
jgi:hypothetical protein